MKKLIAISVVFALVLGAAFAQPSIGGNFKVGTKILKGQSENELDETKVYAGGTFYDNLCLDAKFGDANAGGVLRFYPHSPTLDYEPTFAFVWWRPVPIFRMQLGRNPDGDWGHDQIAGWGFDAEAKAVGVAISTYNDLPKIANTAASSGAWGPGFNSLGLTLSLFPIDGLQVNLGIPFGGNARAAEIYTNLFLNVSYVLEDVGTIRLSAQFRPGSHNRYALNEKEALGVVAPETHWRGNDEDHQPMSIWAAFHLTAIENLGAEVGVGFTLPYTTQDANFQADKDGVFLNVGGEGYDDLPINTKVSSPIKVGIGAQYNSGSFGVKVRAGFNFAGKQAIDAGKAEGYKNQAEDLYKQAAAATIAGDAAKAALLTGNADTVAELYGSTYLTSGVYYQEYTTPSGYNPWVGRAGTQEVVKDPFVWGLNVLPSYKLGNVTIFLGLGIGMKHYAKQEVKTLKLDSKGVYVGDDDDGNTVYETITFEGKPGLYFTETTISKAPETASEWDSFYGKMETVKFDLDWYVNPYVQIPAGGGSFYVGFKLFTDGTRIPVKYEYSQKNADDGVAGKTYPMTSTKYRVKWEVPIGFNWYF